MKRNAIVLGAGIIGVSVAVHLQKRGWSVTLADRRGAGRETSFGNSGIIQREAVYPYAFPRQMGVLLRYALNRSVDVSYHLKALPGLAPFLWRYWQHSGSSRHTEIARIYSRLIEHCVDETRAMAAEAGVEDLLRSNGWIKVFRTGKARDSELREASNWLRDFGVASQELDAGALGALEPDLSRNLVGGIRYEADTVTDPGAMVEGYRQHLQRIGGDFVIADAASLEQHNSGWRIQAAHGPVEASSAVVALGPWADTLLAKFGYRLRLGVKRGYHMHYAARAGSALNRPVLDPERGYLLAPMARGIRLTTGAEFADRDAPMTPVQLNRAEPIARKLFPLGERLDREPWMGLRPCTPDMLPVIGPAPRHQGLWFAFGHAHQGLTLGAVTGRMLAEMMSSATPFIDPAPFAADRAALRA